MARLDAQSLYLINEVIQAVEKVRAATSPASGSPTTASPSWSAVADIAMVVYDRKSRRRADSRVRPD